MPSRFRRTYCPISPSSKPDHSRNPPAGSTAPRGRSGSISATGSG
ncbi:hypothetical protein PybrP1_000627 [[Pythium] brassicae (nom. inval.)]|nr:hypothetical protein PybrP1_000627 [[Pythium] brassicae (nom. inval.)]